MPSTSIAPFSSESISRKDTASGQDSSQRTAPIHEAGQDSAGARLKLNLIFGEAGFKPQAVSPNHPNTDPNAKTITATKAPRPKPGRPVKQQPQLRCSVSLDAQAQAVARKAGGGNLSAGLRLVLAHWSKEGLSSHAKS